MHLLEREIILNCEPNQVWAFLSTPINLNELTPPSLHFQIRSDIPAKMYNGLMILYEIRIPYFGKRRWLTEIKHIEEGVFFVDEQRIGPYRFWYHQHRIESLEGGKTRASDRVFYQLPYGLVGTLVHRFWVRAMLEGIFDFRARRMAELFNQ
jgi:ligand-binding SRPBCC domain-containing protein